MRQKIDCTKATVWLVAMGCVVLGGGSARADVIFGEPTNLGPTVNSISNDQTPSISADGLSLYFSDHEGAPFRPGGCGSSDLWVTTRPTTDDPWGVPVNLGPVVNSLFSDEDPSISSDGLSLYFGSTRAGGSGAHDLWVTTRQTKDSPWGVPVNLGPVVNSAYSEWGPSISADGLSLYFSDYLTVRPGGYGLWDIYVTTRSTPADPWGIPVNLGPVVNSPQRDAAPNIAADGLTLFLNADRPGGSGGADLWMTRRETPEADWEPLVNLGPTINRSGFEAQPNLSFDGSTLYFSSERPNGSGNVDLWQVPIIPIVDLNGDGKVDGVEVRAMAACWGTDDSVWDVGPMPWGDGVVDVQDLRALAAYIGADFDDPTLIGHWALDEAEGAVAVDAAGANDAVVHGAAVWHPEAGCVDGALELDGAGACLTCGSVLDPGTGPFSVLVWIKGGAPGQAIVSQAGGVTWLGIDADGCLMTDLKSTARSSKSLTSQIVVTDGAWHRVGLTWDGTNRALYVDDGLVAADTQDDDLKACSGGLNIGCDAAMTDGTFFAGLIDDLRIYNRAVKP